MLKHIKTVGRSVEPSIPSAADLLAEAAAAGVTVAVHGDQLTIRGPREHQVIGSRLLAREAEALEALRCRAVRPSPEAALESALRVHDWQADISDDATNRRRGEESCSHLLSLAAACDPDKASVLWGRYRPPPGDGCAWGMAAGRIADIAGDSADRDLGCWGHIRRARRVRPSHRSRPIRYDGAAADCGRGLSQPLPLLCGEARRPAVGYARIPTR